MYGMLLLVLILPIVSSVNWIQPLHESNVYFQQKGMLQLENGQYKIVKIIDLLPVQEQINALKTKYIDTIFIEACKANCSSNILTANSKVEFLLHNLNIVYSLLGEEKRDKRSINFIGSGFKYLFGTMDHDDETYFQGVLQNVSNNENLIQDTQRRQFSLITEMNSQTKTLSDNQILLSKKLNAIRDGVQALASNANAQTYKEYLDQAKTHFYSLARALEFHISRIQNAILFLKVGIIDPFFIEPDELIHLMKYEYLRYIVSKVDIDFILRHSTLNAFAHTGEMKIYITLKVPVASPKSYKLYENFVLPKIDSNMIVTLSDTARYFGISADGSEYVEEDELNCFVINKQYICKNAIVRNLGLYPSCLSDIFVRQMDTKCHYRKITDDFSVHNLVNHGILIFSSKDYVLNISCGQFNESKAVNGSVLINMPDQCVLKSDKFSYDSRFWKKDLTLNSIIPRIVCCSPFFQADATVVKEVKLDKFQNIKTLHDIKSIDSERIIENLHKLEKFGKINFPHVYSNAHSYFAGFIAVIVLLIVICVCLKCSHLFVCIKTCFDCCKSKDKDKIVVQFQNSRNNEEAFVHSGYKL